MNEKIERFLVGVKAASPEQFEVISTVRDMFLNYHDAFEEGFKYSGITYGLSGKMVGGIYAYSEHTSIEFSDGSQFYDPIGVLEGNGKYRRHIKIKDTSEIEEKSVSSYIQQSANFS